jgi:hypothetical protein
LVPDGEGEHPAESIHAIFAILFVHVEDDFRVRDCGEVVPLGQEFGRQFTVIVDLSVENDPQGKILIGDGLVAGCEINNAQPPHPDAQREICMDPTSIGPPTGKRLAHVVK